MIRILSRWSDNPRNYWNLMSIFFWYKNAALLEKEHPMVAGFFRLKDRSNRRPGYAVDSLPVHAWKRAKEIARLAISWAKFLKEMEEVWLQTRKKSETEERWLGQIQKIQGEIWQALRIGELQKLYDNAKGTLSEGIENAARSARRVIVENSIEPARFESVLEAMGKSAQRHRGAAPARRRNRAPLAR